MDWLGAVKHVIRMEGARREPEPPEERVRMGPPSPRGRRPAAAAYASKPRSGERRKLQDAAAMVWGELGVVQPETPEEYWRDMGLDANTLSRVSQARLVELLADLSPDISRAVWDFLRMSNAGWTVKVVKEDGETEVKGAAKTALDTFLRELVRIYGSLDVLLNRMLMSGFLRGAFLGELVLDKGGKKPVDLVMPDPSYVRFKKVEDPVRGSIWQLGQVVDGRWSALDVPTIRYLPIDPAPDSPYGRPLATPAVFTSLFLLGLLHDLRRVVAQQGYPRIDVSVSLDEITRGMPGVDEEGNPEDPEEYRRWVAEAMAQVEEVYQNLEPDDAFVHTSAVTVNRPVGTVDSSSLGAVSGLISTLERQIIRALKTMPLLMGVNEAASETHANRQWEVHVAGIKALQHLAESLLEHLLQECLRVQGIQGRVKFRFAELRASEELRDAQVRQLRTINAWNAYIYGWSSHEEAAEYVVGHAPAEEEPLYLPSGIKPVEQYTLAGAQNPTSSAAVEGDAEPEAGNPAAPVAGDKDGKQADQEDGAERMPRVIRGADGAIYVELLPLRPVRRAARRREQEYSNGRHA